MSTATHSTTIAATRWHRSAGPATPRLDDGGRVGYLAKMFPRISETFVLREVIALRQRGIPLRVYSLMAPTRDPRAHPEALELASEVVVLPEPGIRTVGRFVTDLVACLRARPLATMREISRTLVFPARRRLRRLIRAVILAEQLRRDRIAHLHAAWAHTPASVARVACRLAGVPWSMGAHAKDIHLSRPSSLRKKLTAARFTTTCTRANQELLAGIGAPDEPGLPAPSVLLHYHGVDTAYFDVAGRRAAERLRDTPRATIPTPAAQPTAPLIVSVGRLVPKKGFDILIDAASRLRARGVDFRLEILGDGPLRPALAAQIHDLGLDGTVSLEGMKILGEVRTAYQQARCVVLACRVARNGDRDGIPNTLAEAMACGVPVVAAHSETIAELVENGMTGLLVPPEDATALADALERLLADPALGRRLGRSARHHVESSFDGEHWGDRLAARFRSLRGIERVLYLSADRGVPVRGAKGASVHVRAVSRALARIGVEVRIVTTRAGRGDAPRLAAPVIEAATTAGWKQLVSRILARSGGGPPLERACLRLIDNLPFHREAMRQARAWRPDAIYERYALTAVAGSLVARRLGVPHLVEVNAPLAEEEARYRSLRLGWLARRLEGWVLRRADRVIVVSETLAAHARRHGVRPGRILVEPNAVDTELFHPRRDGDRVRAGLDWTGAFVIGFSGTLKPWHGLHHLVRAFARLSGAVAHARLLVIGDGPERDALSGLCRALGIEARVSFIGHVPHETVADHLAACDVLAAPYGPIDHHYFSPLKVAEYLAVGRPVVASAVGQLAEQGGRTPGMILVPPGDEAALAATLTELAIDRTRCARLAGEAAAAPVRTWEDVARDVIEAGEAARREIWRWNS